MTDRTPTPPTSRPAPPARDRADALLAERARRWEGGDRVRAEDYLAELPETDPDSSLLIDLIYQEVILREQSGDVPTLDEYLSRFPALAAELQIQFAVDVIVTPRTALTHPRESGDPPLAEGECPVPRRLLPVIPGHEMLEVLGRGGMGVVYKARHVALDRVVAVKMILHAEAVSGVARARFLAEAEATARLHHPNIVELYEAGERDGVPYFTLEYCAGGSLADRLRSGDPPPRETAALLETLARAVASAHANGVVHRDLSPANILLAGDTPKISDFGLAKRLDRSTGLTGTVAVVGTPCYMAPEQAEGRGRDVGAAADVYGLGAILYRLLTGRPPFGGDTTLATIRQLTERDPERPSRVRPGVPADLETVCLKCLEKDPARRYASAELLADELRRFLDGRPVLARPVSRPERVARWARRNPAGAAVIALALLLAIGSTTAAVLLKGERDTARDNLGRAERAEADARNAQREATRLFVSSLESVPGDVRAMRLHGEAGAYFRGLPRLQEALSAARRLDAPPGAIRAIRGEMMNLLATTDVEVAREWPGAPGDSAAMEFDPTVVRYVRENRDRSLTVHSAESGEELWRAPRRVNLLLSRPTLSPGGTRLAYCDQLTTQPHPEHREGRVDCWPVGGKAGEPLWSRPGIGNVAFSRDGRWTVLPHEKGTSLVVETDTGKERRVLDQGVLCAGQALHPARPLAALRNRQGKIIAVDYLSGTTLGQAAGDGKDREVAVAWHPVRPILAAASEKLIHLWDMEAGVELVPPLEGHLSLGVSMSFEPTGRYLLSNDWSGIVRVWDTATWRQVFHTPGIPATAQFQFAGGGEVAATRAGEKLQLLRVHLGEGLRVIERPVGGKSFGLRLECSPDGRILAVEQDPSGVVLLDATTGRTLGALPDADYLLGFEQPGGALVTAAHGEAALRWPIRHHGDGRATIGPAERFESESNLEIFDGRRTAGGGVSADGGTAVFPAGSEGMQVIPRGRAPRRIARDHPFGVRWAAVSPDGSWAIAASHVSGSIDLYELPSGRRKGTLLSTGGGAIFSPRGTWVACWGSGGGKVFRVGTFECVLDLRGQPTAFSPDDRLVAVGEEGDVIRFLECETGREIVRLDVADRNRLTPAAFSPDGDRFYAFGSDSRALYIWDIRALRTRLRGLNADWDWPWAEPTPGPDPVTAITIRPKGPAPRQGQGPGWGK